MEKDELTVPMYFGWAFKIAVALVVLAFLGLHSIRFFQFTFAETDQLYAWLGFGLTGGGLIAYLAIFKWLAKSALHKGVAIVMIGVCALGELATAGFGMQVEGLQAAGLGMTEQDIKDMTMIVQLLGFLHAGALILDLVGDEIIEAMRGWKQPVGRPAPVAHYPRVENLRPAPTSLAARGNGDGNGHGRNMQLTAPFGRRGWLGREKREPKPGAYQKSDLMAWTENAQGERRRVFCQFCREAGRDWCTPEPCQHILDAVGEPMRLVSNASAQSAGELIGAAFEAEPVAMPAASEPIDGESVTA